MRVGRAPPSQCGKASTSPSIQGIGRSLDRLNPLHGEKPSAYANERAEMDRIRDAFIRATQMADTAGFDLLELHFAHGYLLHSFLSPVTNQRNDAYGGDIDGRMRFPMEVFHSVRTVWPSDKPISVRISATDWLENGWTLDDSVYLARALKEGGCDIIDVSTGQTTPDSKPQFGRLFQTPFAERIRHVAGIPTMTVGNISSYADCNSVLAAGRAAAVEGDGVVEFEVEGLRLRASLAVEA